MTQVRTILHDNFNSLFQSDVDSCTLKRDKSNLNRYTIVSMERGFFDVVMKKL